MYINEYWLVWSFDLVPFAAIFILTGYIVRVNMDVISKWFSLLYFIPVAALSLASGIYNKRVDLFYQQTNSIPLYFIAAFCGIWASIILFKNLPSISIFEKIGRNTLIYYAYHSPIVLYILDIIMGQLAIRYTGIFVNNYIIAGVELVLAICFCEVIAKIINNSFPFLLGKKTNKKVA